MIGLFSTCALAMTKFRSEEENMKIDIIIFRFNVLIDCRQLLQLIIKTRLSNKLATKALAVVYEVQLKSSVFSSVLNIANDKDGFLRTGCRLFQAAGPA